MSTINRSDHPPGPFLDTFMVKEEVNSSGWGHVRINQRNQFEKMDTPEAGSKQLQEIQEIATKVWGDAREQFVILRDLVEKMPKLEFSSSSEELLQLKRLIDNTRAHLDWANNAQKAGKFGHLVSLVPEEELLRDMETFYLFVCIQAEREADAAKQEFRNEMEAACTLSSLVEEGKRVTSVNTLSTQLGPIRTAIAYARAEITHVVAEVLVYKWFRDCKYVRTLLDEQQKKIEELIGTIKNPEIALSPEDTALLKDCKEDIQDLKSAVKIYSQLAYGYQLAAELVQHIQDADSIDRQWCDDAAYEQQTLENLRIVLEHEFPHYFSKPEALNLSATIQQQARSLGLKNAPASWVMALYTPLAQTITNTHSRLQELDSMVRRQEGGIIIT